MSAETKPQYIIVTENDLHIQRLLKDLLSGMNLKNILFATTSEETQQHIEESGIPQLILLNLELDKYQHGLQLLQKLRKEKKLNDTPIIIVSSNAREDMIQACKDFGANDYIIKPFDIDEFKERVIKHTS